MNQGIKSNPHLLQKKLQDFRNVEAIIRCIGIAINALGIPMDKQLAVSIGSFVYNRGNAILLSAKIPPVTIDHQCLISPPSKRDRLHFWQMQKIKEKCDDRNLAQSVVQSVIKSFSDLNIPIDTLTVQSFINQQIGIIVASFAEDKIVLHESEKRTSEDLDQDDFRIDSTDWKEDMLDGVRVKIHPEGDVVEICEGDHKGMQHFTQEAAIRETINQGKILPSIEDMFYISQSINPEIQIYGTSPDKNIMSKDPPAEQGAFTERPYKGLVKRDV